MQDARNSATMQRRDGDSADRANFRRRDRRGTIPRPNSRDRTRENGAGRERNVSAREFTIFLLLLRRGVSAVSITRDILVVARRIARPDLLARRRERLSRPTRRELAPRLPEATARRSILDRRGDLRVPDDRRWNARSGASPLSTLALARPLLEVAMKLSRRLAVPTRLDDLSTEALEGKAT